MNRPQHEALRPSRYPETGSYPSVVATKAGFMISYSKSLMVSTSAPPVSGLWLAPVDAGGQATDHVEPSPGTAQGPAKLATDGPTVLAVWTQQSQQSTLSVAIYGARFDSSGHPIDAAPFLISSVTVPYLGVSRPPAATGRGYEKRQPSWSAPQRS